MVSANLELELIPLEIGVQITPENVEQFREHISRLPPEQQQSIMGRRIQGALAHFKQRNNASEVQSYLSTQADIEASAVDSGYTLLRVFIWLCPILGFIGTVWGISSAVTELAESFTGVTASAEAVAPAAPGAAQSDNQMQKLMNGIRGVTDGLATAFDTTLLGLVCVVLLMFPTEALRKTEYAMLDRVQEFANESLLRRMAEGAGPTEPAELPQVVRQALEGAFKEHQRWLAQWQAQVGQLGQVVGRDFEAAVGVVQERLAQAEAGRLEKLHRAGGLVEELFHKVTDGVKAWHDAAGADVPRLLTTLADLQRALGDNAAVLNQAAAAQRDLAERYRSNDLAEVLGDLRDAIRGLNGRPEPAPLPAVPEPEPIEQVSQVTLVKPKGSVFGGLFGRDNG